MNRKIVFGVTGRFLEILSLLMLLPLTVSIIYKENRVFVAFLIAIFIALSIGVTLRLLTKGCNKTMYAREGFLIVALAWLCASLVGCLPYFLSGEVPGFVDAFFETVSGFTTTGASILPDVEALSHGLLFWRSFTVWIGGMGVLVFMVAFANSLSDRAIHILRAEMPGPIVGKIVPRAKDTSKVLYIMYIVLTLIQTVLMICGGMPVFDSITHAFSAAGTGGFGIKADSIASYSPYIQWVIGVFLVIFGINFNIYYLMIIRRLKTAVKSGELWTYLGIITVSTVLIAFNIRGIYPNLSDNIRTSFFQVSSIITTAGFATADFNLWPSFSKAIIFMLTFLGACAGSTGGGLKVSRAVLIFKMIGREIRKMLHPRAVTSVKFEGRDVDDHVQRSVSTYFAVYMMCIFITFLFLSLEPFSFETNFSAAVTCFNNVGPGFGMVGPSGSFAAYSDFSKIVLSFCMLFGRLEVFPMLIALNPATWRKR